MGITDQEYANLADDAYKDIDIEKYVINQEDYFVKGITYKVLEHYSDKDTDYQGTIYQRVDTGEIIVAHRGTASLEDAVIDYGMVTREVNLQIPHALALTERALEFARDHEREFGFLPQVSITGHSLAGTLSEIDAYEHELKAVTFNGYGSVGLGYTNTEGEYKKVPEKYEGDIRNHMMAGDVVNIANPHIGQEVIHARRKEIDSMRFWGYEYDGPKGNNLWYALAMQTFKYDVHSMSNFIDSDGSPSMLSVASLETKSIAQIEVDRQIYENFRQNVKDNVEPSIEVINNVEKWIVQQFEQGHVEIPADMPEGMKKFFAGMIERQVEKHGDNVDTVKNIVSSSDDFKSTFDANYVAPAKEELVYNPFIPREYQHIESNKKQISEADIILGQILDIGKHAHLNTGRFIELCEQYARLPEKQVIIQECINKAYENRAIVQEQQNIENNKPSFKMSM